MKITTKQYDQYSDAVDELMNSADECEEAVKLLIKAAKGITDDDNISLMKENIDSIREFAKDMYEQFRMDTEVIHTVEEYE